MKFSVSPIGGEVAQREFSDQEKKKWRDFSDYLAQALKATLIRGDAVWLSFKV